METNKKLQNLIGNAIDKDYFKLEFRQIEKRGIIIGQEYKPEWKCETALIYKDWLNKENIPLGELEILGTEPTLNDVLLAIEKKERLGHNYFFITSEGKMLCLDKKEITYNLNESLFNQEQEVKVAIINLLEDK